jgi:thymidylate synthase ThyX
MNEPKVTLLNWTPLPKETVYSVWDLSKTMNPIRTPAEIRRDVPAEEVNKLFRAVIAQHIPVGEQIDFLFAIENVAVSWREQAVRHRIGAKPSPERVGVDFAMDVIPDKADSSFWSQSMRIDDMGTFAQEGKYRTPDTLLGKHCPGRSEEFKGRMPNTDLFRDQPAATVYHAAMAMIEDAYNALVLAGVPMEDARELLPLGTQQRLTWKLNLSALQHIVGKRGCWILQLGIWGPVIQGMITELAEKVDPIFQELVSPPCIKPTPAEPRGEYVGCTYHEECRRRYTGDDKLPPCPLHLAQEQIKNPDKVRLTVFKEDFRITHPTTGESVPLPMRRDMLQRAEDYTQFWGRDVYTGEKLR